MTNAMTIDDITKHIIKIEGGYSEHPNDRGGPTNMGITQKTLTSFLGRSTTADDIRRMTVKQAKDIYEQHYYHYPRIDRLPDILQPIMVDMAVNHGPRRAIKLLQEELQHGGFNVGRIDGVIGQMTIKATNHALAEHSTDFIDYLINRRLAFYHDIVNRDPTQAVFLNGWIARAESYRLGNWEVYA